MPNIPLFDLNFDEMEEQAVLDVLRSKWISSGPKCAELEKNFSTMLGARHALALSNCTAALHLAVLVCGIGPGDEVIVPSLTFVATANCVRYAGATPVMCDIESLDRPVIDAQKIEGLITERTKAIIPMHYAGFPCNMDAIIRVAEKHDLKIIEDACHGPLSEYHGRKLGTFGSIGCFSFFSNKNISTGEGGIVVTDDERLYEKMKLMRSHGMTSISYDRAKGHSTGYDVIDLGYNYRMDDIRASIGIAQLTKLKGDIERRQMVREYYLRHLCDCNEVIIPFADWNEISSSYIFPLVLRNGGRERRDALRKYLSEKGIQTSVHYPPVHRFKIYEDFARKELPLTETYSDSEFTLPMYGKLTAEDVAYISSCVKDFLMAIKQS